MSRCAKAGDDPKKLRKVVRKKAPAGQITWGEGSFDRLVAAEPEPLVPQLKLTAAMLINVIGRGGDVIGDIRSLVFDNHEPRARQFELARRALEIFRTLRDAGVVEILPAAGPDAASASNSATNDPFGASGWRESTRSSLPMVRLTVDLQPNFALNQPLSPFALAAIELLDQTAAAGTGIATGHYALDVVSIIESTLDDPRPILSQQQYKARGEAVAAMKQEGIEYDERMELLEQVTWPKPLDELLAQAFETFASSQPWVRDFELSPKSVVRDMFERSMSFGEYVSLLPARPQRGARAALPLRRVPRDPADGAERGEGRGAPRHHRVARRARATGRLEPRRRVERAHRPRRRTCPRTRPRSCPPRRRRSSRTGARSRCSCATSCSAGCSSPPSNATTSSPSSTPTPDGPTHSTATTPSTTTSAREPPPRSPRLVTIDETDAASGMWRVEQTIDDPAGDHDWRIRAEVDLEASAEEGAAVVRVTEVVRL